MREIIFRGKLTANGEWSEGNLQIAKNGVAIITPDETVIGSYGQVVPESVGEYTGICDKNGTKIFEGDIISIPFEEDRSPWEESCIYYENGEVYFCAEHHGWYVRFYDDDTLSLWEYDELDVEVIGNIHDNPELLEAEK